MAEALAATPGALGVFSLGAIMINRLPLKWVALDGVSPSLATLANGRWRAIRDLAFVIRRERLALTQPFLKFLASPSALALMRENGYLPLVKAP
jgi:phosphate transport system substrate-binding protein